MADQQQNGNNKGGFTNCMAILLAIFLPPLGVFLKFKCKCEFWLCVMLTLFGYVPGIVFAVYALTAMEPETPL